METALLSPPPRFEGGGLGWGFLGLAGSRNTLLSNDPHPSPPLRSEGEGKSIAALYISRQLVPFVLRLDLCLVPAKLSCKDPTHPTLPPRFFEGEGSLLRGGGFGSRNTLLSNDPHPSPPPRSEGGGGGKSTRLHPAAACPIRITSGPLIPSPSLLRGGGLGWGFLELAGSRDTLLSNDPTLALPLVSEGEGKSIAALYNPRQLVRFVLLCLVPRINRSPGQVNPCSRAILAYFDEQAFSASQLLVPSTLATQQFDICSRNDDAREAAEQANRNSKKNRHRTCIPTSSGATLRCQSDPNNLQCAWRAAQPRRATLLQITQ